MKPRVDGARGAARRRPAGRRTRRPGSPSSCGAIPALPADLLRGLARRHGTRALAVLGDAKTPADLGEDFGHGLTAAEIDYLVREEWARSGDDVLWRRTKCGIGMTDAERERVAAYVRRGAAVRRRERAA